MRFKKPKFSKKSFVRFFTSLVVFGIIAAIFVRLSTPAVQAAWFDDTYTYRLKFTFTHNAEISANRSVTFTLDTAELISANLMQSDCDDTRFTDVNGKELAYDLTGTCNNAATTYEVIFPTIVNGTNTGYVYYGNPGARNNETDSTQFTALTPSGGDPSDSTPTSSDEQGPAPVSYWDFDENNGSTANDKFATQANNLTITNSLWKSSDVCAFNGCLYFDGNADRASKTYSSDTELLPSTTSFTISTWAKHTSTAGADTLISRADGVNGVGWKLYMDGSGFICFGIDGSAGSFPSNSACTTTSYADSQWHYIVGVKSGTTSITLYIDGQQITQTTGITASSLDGTNSPFTVGNDFDNGTNGWDGFIDEVKYYNFEKSATQVKTEYSAKSQTKAASATFDSSSGISSLSNGLLGFWKMDESSWTGDCSTNTATDSSGNGNSGKACPNASAANTSTTAKFNYAGSFDGTNDVLKTAITTAPTSFTASIWSYATNTSFTGAMMAKYGSGPNRGFFLRTNGSGVVRATITDNSGTGTDIDGTIAATTWTHYVVTYDATSSQMVLYQNGALVNAKTATLGTNSANLYIGANYDGDAEFFNGKLDDARYYNRALTAQEVANLYYWHPDPVGYWKFDDNSGTAPVDSSGNANTGSFSNSPIWTSGKFGSGVGLKSGSSQAVRVTDSNSLDVAGHGTMMAWVKRTTSGAFMTVMSKSDSNTPAANNYGFEFNSTNVIDTVFGNGGAYSQTCSTTSTFSDTTNWHHYAITWDLSNIKIYADGVFNASCSQTGTPTANTATLRIGEFGGNTDYMNGNMDEVKVFNYDLTPSQIIQEMNAGHPTVGTPVGSYVAYWNFDEASGTTANDKSVNSNSLTLSSASWTASGKYGSAWNGTGSVWLSRSDDNDLDFVAADDFSISLWFKSDSASNPANNEYLIEKGTITNTGTAGYAIYANSSGNIVFGIKDDAAWGASSPNTITPDDTATSTTDLYDNTWHHIVATKTGTTRIDLYVDGRLDASDTSIAATATLANSIAMRVGDDDADSANSFNGDLDETKIYRSALTLYDVLTEYNRGQASMFGSTGTNSSGTVDNSLDREFCIPGDSTSCSAPVGWWKFDENTGTSAKDSSGSGNNATLNGGSPNPAWVPGKYGPAVKFSGGTTNLDASNASSVRITGALSVSAWVYVTTGSTTQDVIARSGTSTQHSYRLLVDSTNLGYFGVAGSCVAPGTYTTATSTTTLTTNTWYHLEGVYVPSTSVKLYVNGVLEATNTTSIPASLCNPTTSLTLGGEQGGNVFNGYIDDARLYNYARTDAQVAWDYNRGNPAFWYKFDECQGSTAYDIVSRKDVTISVGASGNTSLGTCGSGVSTQFWNDGTNGKYSSAGGFDGNDDYGQSPNSPGLPTTDFTYSVWIYLNDNTDERIFMAADGSANNEVSLAVESGNLITVVNGTTADATSSITLNTGQWYNVITTRSGSTITQYINGQADPNTGSDGAALDFTTCPLMIATDVDSGCTGSLGNYFDGLIDDLQIYRYTLTATQVKNLYNQNSTVRFGPVTGTP